MTVVIFRPERNVLPRHVIKRNRRIPSFERIPRIPRKIRRIRRRRNRRLSIDGRNQHKIPPRIVDLPAAECQPEQIPVLEERPEKEEWLQLAEVEGQYVARVLAHTGGNKQAASRLLGVDRKTLDRMIKRHDIRLPGKESAAVG